MSGKSKEEIAFELVAKLKGVGIWGENNIESILDMYAQCLEATSGLRPVSGKPPTALRLQGQEAAPAKAAPAAAPAAPAPAMRQAAPSQQVPVQQPPVQHPAAQPPQVRHAQPLAQPAAQPVYQQQRPQ